LCSAVHSFAPVKSAVVRGVTLGKNLWSNGINVQKLLKTLKLKIVSWLLLGVPEICPFILEVLNVLTLLPET